MVFITADTWRKNSVEVIIVNDIKWLNQKKYRRTVRQVYF